MDVLRHTQEKVVRFLLMCHPFSLMLKRHRAQTFNNLTTHVERWVLY